MIHALRLLMIGTGVAVWAFWLFFLVVGSLASLRQWREQRADGIAAFEDHLDGLRDEGTGRVWVRQRETGR